MTIDTRIKKLEEKAGLNFKPIETLIVADPNGDGSWRKDYPTEQYPDTYFFVLSPLQPSDKAGD